MLASHSATSIGSSASRGGGDGWDNAMTDTVDVSGLPLQEAVMKLIAQNKLLLFKLNCKDDSNAARRQVKQTKAQLAEQAAAHRSEIKRLASEKQRLESMVRQLSAAAPAQVPPVSPGRMKSGLQLFGSFRSSASETGSAEIETMTLQVQELQEDKQRLLLELESVKQYAHDIRAQLSGEISSSRRGSETDTSNMSLQQLQQEAARWKAEAGKLSWQLEELEEAASSAEQLEEENQRLKFQIVELEAAMKAAGAALRPCTSQRSSPALTTKQHNDDGWDNWSDGGSDAAEVHTTNTEPCSDINGAAAACVDDAALRALQLELDAAKQQLAAAQSEKEAVQQQLERLQTRAATLRNKHAALQQQHSTLQREHRTLTEQRDADAASSTQHLHDELIELRQQHAAATASHTAARQELAATAAELAALQAQHATLQAAFAELQQQRGTATDCDGWDVSDNAAECSADDAADELHELRRKYNDLLIEFENMKVSSTREMASAVCHDMKLPSRSAPQAVQHDARHADMAVQHDGLAAQHTALQAQHEQLRQQCQQLQSQITALENTLAEQQSHTAALRVERDDALRAARAQQHAQHAQQHNHEPTVFEAAAAEPSAQSSQLQPDAQHSTDTQARPSTACQTTPKPSSSHAPAADSDKTHAVPAIANQVWECIDQTCGNDNRDAYAVDAVDDGDAQRDAVHDDVVALLTEKQRLACALEDVQQHYELLQREHAVLHREYAVLQRKHDDTRALLLAPRPEATNGGGAAPQLTLKSRPSRPQSASPVRRGHHTLHTLLGGSCPNSNASSPLLHDGPDLVAGTSPNLSEPILILADGDMADPDLPALAPHAFLPDQTSHSLPISHNTDHSLGFSSSHGYHSGGNMVHRRPNSPLKSQSPRIAVLQTTESPFNSPAVDGLSDTNAATVLSNDTSAANNDFGIADATTGGNERSEPSSKLVNDNGAACNDSTAHATVDAMRREIEALRCALQDSERTHELRSTAWEVLKAEVAELKRQQHRSDNVDLEYIKHVLVSALESHELQANPRMLSVLDRLLHFSPEDLQKVGHVKGSKSPQRNSSSTAAVTSATKQWSLFGRGAAHAP